MDLTDANSGLSNFIELKVVSWDINLGHVHTCTGNGVHTRVTFTNGVPPPIPNGAILSIWNYEKDNSMPENKGLVIDLTGQCRWVWKSPGDENCNIEPVFGELFSGLGGWTRGLKNFDADSSILVEKDITVAKACATSLKMPLCHIDSLYKQLCMGFAPKPCVLVGDLADTRVWTILSYMRIEVACMSPPCQPWSKASWESGLQVSDGKIFAKVFQMAPRVGIRVLNTENVGNIVMHPHFSALIEFAKSKGYKCLHEGAYDVYPFLPIKRERWLATFIELSLKTPDYAREWVAKVQFPIMSMGAANLQRRDCLQQHFDTDEWIELQPCPDAIMKLNRKELLPCKFPVNDGQTTFQARLCTEFDPIGGAMAMYGRQHTLPIDLLRSKGLFTTLLKVVSSEDPPRYYSAWEFLAAMAWPNDVFLPLNKFDAWHAAGNAISIPHTVLCIFKMHGGLLSKSPFGDHFFSLRSLCEKMFDRSIKLSKVIPYTDDDHKRLKNIQGLHEVSKNDLPSEKTEPEAIVPQSVHPANVQPRSNPFARVHNLPQGPATAESFPFRMIDHDKICKGDRVPHDAITPCKCTGDSGNPNIRNLESISIHTSMCPSEMNGFTHSDKKIDMPIHPTQIDEEQDFHDDGVSRCLSKKFEDVANEAKHDRVFKKRKQNDDDDDTWHFNIGLEQDFKVSNGCDVAPIFSDVDWNELEKTMVQLYNKSGLNRMWPLARQVMIYCPIDKWSCVTVMHQGLSVIEMIRNFLPESRSSHFHCVMINGQHVTPQSIPPGTGKVIIVFVPVEAKCSVHMPDGSIVESKVDVTSTADDICVQLQQRSNIKASSIEIFHKGNRIESWDRICMCDSPELVAKVNTFVRMPDNMATIASKVQVTFPPAHSDVMISAKLHSIRFAIRHPVWTTVRTVTATMQDKIGDMLEKMFPDLKQQCQISMMDHGGNILNEMPVSLINIGAYYEVEFGATHPYPVTQIEIVQPIGIVDQMNIGKKEKCSHCISVKRWVRTPFQTKPYEQHFAKHQTLTRMAAQYFAHCESTQTVMTMIDGKAVDPRTQIGDIPEDRVVTFRACPMLGGGKERDKDVKKILNEQFLSRGVPKESIQSRVEGFLAKVASDKIRTHSGETWARQWVSIKQLANEAHFRLITTDELRAFQTKKKTNRNQEVASSASTNASSAGSSITSRGSNGTNPKQLNLSEIRIDLSYFKAAGEEVKMISVEAFGPDSCGVIAMHIDSAIKYLPIKRLSADPLAIIAVGSKPITDAPIKMVPATSGKGEPILIPMCILNFGDTPIMFHEGSMKADLATQDAMVVEFTIYRNEVEAWDDVKSPVVYLGLKISETKSTKILSTWAVKSYSEQRKPTEHAKASYVHGYLRVLEASADPILARSGWFGIYLVPKNSQKKPREAYSIVPVPNKSVEQLQAIVQSTKNALGIVKTMNALAVRCRREHTFVIKKVIFPDLPLQEEGVFSQGDSLFVLKHLESHTNITELTDALRKLGWKDAKALKPLGANAWSIAAPDDPPSSHVCLNGRFVVIAPQGKPKGVDRTVAHIPSTVAITNGTTPNVVHTAPTTSTRIDELKTDLQGQVQAMIDAKMKESVGEIKQLKHAMGETHEAIAQIKDAQEKTDQKIKDVETTIHSNGESLVSKLTSMFGELQNNLNLRLDKLETAPEEKDTKRPRH